MFSVYSSTSPKVAHHPSLKINEFGHCNASLYCFLSRWDAKKRKKHNHSLKKKGCDFGWFCMLSCTLTANMKRMVTYHVLPWCFFRHHSFFQFSVEFEGFIIWHSMFLNFHKQFLLVHVWCLIHLKSIILVWVFGVGGYPVWCGRNQANYKM